MTTTLPRPETWLWVRVNRRNPCPICQRADWCTIAGDGSGNCCMRVQSEKPMRNGGWFHVNGDHLPDRDRYLPAKPEPKPVVAWNTLLASWKLNTTPAMIIQHADKLGVDPIAMDMLGAVYAKEHQAWAWPMRDGQGNVCGIRLRNVDGDKWAVKGSNAGLFEPRTEPQRRLHIAEGPTDTAALLSLGLFAVGRPSCLGQEDTINATVRRLGISEVVIMSDADEPGQRGAGKLQRWLSVPSVIVTPPAKDVREAVAAGWDTDEINNTVHGMRFHVADPTKQVKS